MRSRVREVDSQAEPRTAVLLRRARRSTLRGDARQAMLALREATCVAATDARLWALYGAACFRAKRPDAAEEAIRQAIWLRERERDPRRARSLAAFLAASSTKPVRAA